MSAQKLTEFSPRDRDRNPRGSGRGTAGKALLVSLAIHAVLAAVLVSFTLPAYISTSAEAVAAPVYDIRVKMEPRSQGAAAPVKVGAAAMRERMRPDRMPMKVPALAVDRRPSVSFEIPKMAPTPSTPVGLTSRGEFSESDFAAQGSLLGTAGGAESAGTPGASTGPAQIGSEGSAGYVGSPRLDYPASARRLGLEGRCVLLITIAEDDSLVDAQVTVSSGHKLLDEAALRCARECRYYAAQVGTRKVRSVVEWPFVFKLAK